jgi:hypothetical protein
MARSWWYHCPSWNALVEPPFDPIYWPIQAIIHKIKKLSTNFPKYVDNFWNAEVILDKPGVAKRSMKHFSFTFEKNNGNFISQNKEHSG